MSLFGSEAGGDEMRWTILIIATCQKTTRAQDSTCAREQDAPQENEQGAQTATLSRFAIVASVWGRAQRIE
jgi:hypothetical protein